MTNQVLFIQGGGEGTHDEWDNELLASLTRELGPDYAICYPRMPNEADPNYAAWKTTLERQFDGLDDGAIVVGHSIGGTILIKTLADDPPQLTFGGIFLIAPPFVGDGGWHSDDIELSDLGAKLAEETPIYLYHGGRDQTTPFEHVGLYAKALPRAVVPDSLAATISSITTCLRLPPISGALQLSAVSAERLVPRLHSVVRGHLDLHFHRGGLQHRPGAPAAVGGRVREGRVGPLQYEVEPRRASSAHAGRVLVPRGLRHPRHLGLSTRGWLQTPARRGVDSGWPEQVARERPRGPRRRLR